MLPQLIVKKMEGGPKKMLESSQRSGTYKRMSYRGRKMHCGYCIKEGHKINASPDKPARPN